MENPIYVTTIKTETIHHKDGWGYIITDHDGDIEIKYFERDDIKEKIKKTFSISYLCYKEVAQAIINVGSVIGDELEK